MPKTDEAITHNGQTWDFDLDPERFWYAWLAVNSLAGSVQSFQSNIGKADFSNCPKLSGYCTKYNSIVSSLGGSSSSSMTETIGPLVSHMNAMKGAFEAADKDTRDLFNELAAEYNAMREEFGADFVQTADIADNAAAWGIDSAFDLAYSTLPVFLACRSLYRSAGVAGDMAEVISKYVFELAKSGIYGTDFDYTSATFNMGTAVGYVIFASYYKEDFTNWLVQQGTSLYTNYSGAFSSFANGALSAGMELFANYGVTAGALAIMYTSASFFTALQNGESFQEAFDDSGWGANFLLTSIQTICASAGTFIAGPWGGRIGSAVGCYLGALARAGFVYDGEIEEGWCAAAGAAVIIGGSAAGGITATALGVAVTAGTVCPAVGLAILAGAVLGYGIVFVAHEASVYRRNKEEAYENDYGAALFEYLSYNNMLTEGLNETLNNALDPSQTQFTRSYFIQILMCYDGYIEEYLEHIKGDERLCWEYLQIIKGDPELEAQYEEITGRKAHGYYSYDYDSEYD